MEILLEELDTSASLLSAWLELELMEASLELELDVSALLLLTWLEFELAKGQYSLNMPPLGQSR
jgi:hypothetical protein